MYCMRQGSSGEVMPFSAIHVYVVSDSIGNVIQVKNLIYLWLLHALIIIILLSLLFKSQYRYM